MTSDMALVSPSSPSYTQKGFQLPMLRHYDAHQPQQQEEEGTHGQQQPLPIPGALTNTSHGQDGHPVNAPGTSQSPPDILPTPPDGVRIPSHKAPSAPATRPRAPSTSSVIAASPRLASLSSSFWSPKQPRAEPHLYGTSASGRSLSTSFKLSAERGGLGPFPHHADPDDEEYRADDIFDDAFEQDAVTLQRRGAPAKREEGEGDAAGVFSFSSPYFGPQAVGEGDIPYSPGLGDPAKASAATRLMSPNWTALTLSQLSLSGSPETRNASVHIPRRPSGRPSHSYSFSQSAGGHHRPSSVPNSAENAIHSATQQRRLSFQRNSSSRGGTGALLASAPPSSYTYSGSPSSASPYGRTGRTSRPSETHRSASRSRSRSRRKLGESVGQTSNATGADDMQLDGVPSNSTDDEMALSDDDATEDEAEPRNRRTVRRESAGSATYGVSPHSAHTHPYASARRPSQIERTRSGASLGLSFNDSPGSGGSILSRQYSADQRAGAAGAAAGLSMGSAARHHPYAPPNPAMGRYAYSPNQPSTLSELGALATSLPAGYSTRRAYADASAATSLGGTDDETEDDQGSDEDDETDEDSDVDERMATSRDGLSAISAAAVAVTHLNGASRSSHTATSHPPTDTPGASSTAAAASAIRTRLGGSSSCSAFISKLWYLMSNPDLYADYIRWSVSGDSVILYTETERSERFARDVLPKLFKHNNVASFVRQLNLYGFQRTQSARLLDAEEARLAPSRIAKHPSSDITDGVPPSSSPSSAGASGIGPNGIPTTAAAFYGPHSSFSHPHFRRGQEELLPTLKPRSSKKPKKAGGGTEGGGEE